MHDLLLKDINKKIALFETTFETSDPKKNESLIEEIDADIYKLFSSIAKKIEHLKIEYEIILSKLDILDWQSVRYPRCLTDISYISFNRIAVADYEIKSKLKNYYTQKGVFLKNNEQYDEALNAWEEVLKIDPVNETIHNYLDNWIKESEVSEESEFK